MKKRIRTGLPFDYRSGRPERGRGVKTGPYLRVALLAAGCMPAPATSTTPEGGSPMPSSIVDPYLTIQTSPVGDSLTPPEGVQIAQCETRRKQWLQEGDSIANSYDGSSAPACGSFR